MEQLQRICSKSQVFTWEEASHLLPLVKKITQKNHFFVNSLIAQYESLKGTGQSTDHIELKINIAIKNWQTKIEKLGANARGLWIVDFFAGNGYYCWKFPEEQIKYWHKHSNEHCSRSRVLAEDSCQSEMTY